ncbi:hypothetical protein TNCV_25561 [Trichonephila clavipes]|uniref:Uncharacterized protein n=1 Tax=Trichonephila clavipes TaxID=2585209 RepID=A0A8X7BD78_TRICX|nr:hypothetical protein TNCV_25561 [Trichonephila clavipes]
MDCQKSVTSRTAPSQVPCSVYSTNFNASGVETELIGGQSVDLFSFLKKAEVLPVWSSDGRENKASYTRAFNDGPRNFEPQSSDEDDT